MSDDRLEVVLYGKRIGWVERGPQGPVFTYRSAERGAPLSVNLPRSTSTYPTRRTLPFLAGLLPEDDLVRQRLATELDVDRPDPMSLLGVMGWDCPGAVQLTTEDRLPDMLARTGALIPVTADEIGRRLDEVRRPGASWVQSGEHWSLAGQQSKIALVRTAHGWAQARGSEPTTHIIKPGIGRLHHQALIEHATMRAAGMLAVAVAPTDYTDFAGRPAIVVERFDRITSGSTVVRVHQEDMAQATGRMPERKYEADGGPGVAEMASVLRAHSRDQDAQLAALADFLLINYAAQAPDGHAKNVSVRILPTGNVTLAPLYDLASALPFDQASIDRSLALSIGGRRRINDIHARQWNRAAADLGVDEGWLRDRARVLVAGFPDAFEAALAEVGTPEANEVWQRSAERAARHRDLCLSRLDEPTRPPVGN